MESLANTVPVGGHDSEFVECRQCGENLQRSLISEHESEQCSKRPFSCEYCKQYKSTFEDVSTNHWPKCNNYPVPCPEHCETTAIQRQNLEHHINEECPLTTVKCSFSHAGCEVQLHRRDLSSHLAENIGTHLDLLGSQNRKLQQEAADKDAHITRLAKELQEVQNHLDEEIGAQNQRLAQETADKKSHIERMTKVNKELKGNVDQLSMHQNASKREIDQLKRAQINSIWGFIVVTALMAVLMAVVISFRGHITSLQGQYHHIESNITSLQGQYHYIESNITSLQGQYHYIESNITSLQGQYHHIESNITSLQRQYRHILTTLQSHYKRLPPYFITMCDFQWHKDNDDYWYSPPFYTHPQGYKMCLRVYANGNGNGKDTHVSVFAQLMQGEFDDDLKWPFRGRVVIQLCNQLQDKYHRGHTIDFSQTTFARVISRVTSGTTAEDGLGAPTLILHNDLDFNPTTNCQYLKNDCLRFQIVAVESLSEPGVLPTELTMTNFEQHKIDNDNWFSPPFYTHPQGYKMCLRVYANGNGNGKGTHVSVFAFLMQGEFDDDLKWPFRGRVVIQLCNQLQDKYHHGHTIDFSQTTTARAFSRVTSGTTAEVGWGTPTLILHHDLDFNPTTNCQYLKNDCLHFQIVAVESLSEPGVLPTELTMTNFEQHKIDSDNWFSPPFYTHPQGYKMCLSVDANGVGHGEGTHVSVFPHLMQGEFDDDLKWPFQGRVVIQLCNQLQDKYHRGFTIDLSKTTDAEIISRVTTGDRAKSGLGLPTLILHNDLDFNPTTNSQYLKNDYLRFQIVAVESLSEPGVLPTELTMTNFEQHRIDSDDWFSPPFYTHPQGYKMCLRVYANGDGNGKGTHVSVYAFLMQGEFDDDLKWPFRGDIVIQLRNQLQDKYHRGHIIDFNEKTDAKVISRVTSGTIAEVGRGTPTLILHNDINFNPTTNCQYLKNDCLRFQIVAVESLSEPVVLPTELTMTNFEQHKLDSDRWYSPPFYTHPEGYKMCLRVYANGDGDGKGTHVSVYAQPMQGEFDDDLKWPFQGHVTVAMLNQLEDNHHTIHTIHFTNTTGNRVIGRVVEGERDGLDYNIIAHNELNYNPTKNCQYLKYDSLRFRIKVEL